MKKQLIWVFEWRKSVHYWWSYKLFSPECKELTSMLDPLLYKWGVPPVVIRCVHWTMQMGVLQTWITTQSPAFITTIHFLNKLMEIVGYDTQQSPILVQAAAVVVVSTPSTGAVGCVQSSKGQAPVPLTIFRSNSKLNQNLECSNFKYTSPITTKFCTHHDVCKMSSWSVKCISNQGTWNFGRISNWNEILLVGPAPGLLSSRVGIDYD